MAGKTSARSAKVARKATAKPVLLSGGNPQIAKGDGDAPVQAYIAAMRAGNATSDASSTRSSCARPRRAQGSEMELAFYGVEGSGRLVPRLSLLHEVRQSDVLSAAGSLRLSAGESKSQDTRYLDIYEDDQLDEAQLAAWVKHASQLPGERM